MPSDAYERWTSTAQRQLDELDDAHTALRLHKGWSGVATLQLEYAYVVMLSSHFQRFCRDLHSEAADHLANSLSSAWATRLTRAALTEARRLDRGNPNPGNLGADFGRIGMPFWDVVLLAGPHGRADKGKLEQLNAWRNAIAHHDFTRPTSLDLGGGRTTLRLADVHAWRRSMRRLAGVFDRVVGDHLFHLTSIVPW